MTAVTTAGLLAGLFGSAFVPVAQGAAGVLDATETTFTETDTLEGSGTSALPLELYAVTMAAAAEADATITFDIEDSTGTNVAGAATITASGAIDVVNGGAHVSSYSETITGGVLVVEVAAKTTSTSGTGTLTISVLGGTETVYYKVFGPVTSCSLSNEGISNLAAVATSEDEGIELTCLDASGYDITGNAAAKAGEAADADVSWAIASGSVGAAGDVVEADNNLTFDLAATACDTGDTGDVYSARATVVNGLSASVTTNYVTFTCTEAVATVITNVTLSATSVVPGGTIYAYFHADDGYGSGLGYGGVVDFAAAAAEPIFAGTRSISPVTVPTGYTNSALTYPAADLVVGTAGNINNVVRVALTAANLPGNYALIIDITDIDKDTAGNQAGSYTLQYVVTDPAAATGSSTIAASVNAAKRIATFTLSAAANKLVTITVERISDGKVWTYYRKANASGVATFLIRKFGRFDVFASYGDDVTDTVRMRRR